MFGFERRTGALLAAVERLGSVSAAARELGVDASNALRHLRAAERRAGAALVERSRGGARGGRARLTRAGRAVLAAAGARRPPGREARLLGVAGAFDAEAGVTPVAVGARRLLVAGRVPPGPAEVAFREEDVALERPPRGARATSSVRNAWPVRVRRLHETPEGPVGVELVAGALAFRALVTRGAARDLRLRPGSRLVATVKATALRASPLGG